MKIVFKVMVMFSLCFSLSARAEYEIYDDLVKLDTYIKAGSDTQVLGLIYNVIEEDVSVEHILTLVIWTHEKRPEIEKLVNQGKTYYIASHPENDRPVINILQKAFTTVGRVSPYYFDIIEKIFGRGRFKNNLVYFLFESNESFRDLLMGFQNNLIEVPSRIVPDYFSRFTPELGLKYLAGLSCPVPSLSRNSSYESADIDSDSSPLVTALDGFIEFLLSNSEPPKNIYTSPDLSRVAIQGLSAEWVYTNRILDMRNKMIKDHTIDIYRVTSDKYSILTDREIEIYFSKQWRATVATPSDAIFAPSVSTGWESPREPVMTTSESVKETSKGSSSH